jgi:hypothetical protein
MPHSQRGLDERRISEGLMAHVAGVIDEQLQSPEARWQNATLAM